MRVADCFLFHICQLCRIMYIRFDAILSQFLLVALSDGFRGYAKLLRQSENLSKKQDSVYTCRSQINTVLQFVKSRFYNIAISFFDNPVALAIIRKSTPSSFNTFAIRIFSSLRPSALPSSRPFASPSAKPSAFAVFSML